MPKDRAIAARGYVFIHAPTHPKANRSGYVPEHTTIAEKALGKFLPDGAEIHHIDEVRTHNATTNLVICQDRAYHMLVHQRTRALRACGNANFRKCQFCKFYGDPLKMRVNGKGFSHWSCYRAFMRTYYANNREKWGICAQPK